MSLGSGALLDYAVAPYEGKETGEPQDSDKTFQYTNQRVL